jgi:exodeoxyribonuclease-3
VLSVLTVNIGAASPERARQLLAWLAGRPEDILMLTETSAGPGTEYLLDQFRHAGYAVVKTPDADGERGSALISRVALLRELTEDLSAISVPCRIAGAVLDSEPTIAVLGVYVPSRDRSVAKTDRKQRFIQSLIDTYDQLPPDLARRTVIGGDYNVIARTHHPLHPGFLPFEFGLLDSLRSRGLVDIHDQLSPGVQAHSWIGRTGDGYRYDYLHVSQDLAHLATTCAYLHETREQKLTDHAAVTITLRADARCLSTSDPLTAGAADLLTLF